VAQVIAGKVVPALCMIHSMHRAQWLSLGANVRSGVCLCVIGASAGFGLHQVYAVNWTPAEAECECQCNSVTLHA
jgi:hypothetical protein